MQAIKENEIKGQEWQQRRRANESGQESLLEQMNKWKAEQREKDLEREKFNKKYTEKNKQITEDYRVASMKRQAVESPQKSSQDFSPSKPPPKQKIRNDGEEFRQQIVSVSDESQSLSISYKELIEHMNTTGLKYTNPLQKKFLQDYICKKINVSEQNLSYSEEDELSKVVTKFFATFCKKFTDTKVSRTIGRLLSDDWCSNSINLPSTIKQHGSCKPVTTESDKNDEGGGIKFSHGELIQVMKDSQFSFTAIQDQVMAIKKHILKMILVNEDEVKTGMYELNEQIRMFVVHTIAKYKKSNRTFDNLKAKLFKSKRADDLSFELSDSLVKQLRSKTAFSEDQTNLTEQQHISVERNLTLTKRLEENPNTARKSKPFLEKSVRSQLYACKDLRESFESDLIIATAAQVVKTPAMGRLIKRAHSNTGRTAQLALDAIKENATGSKAPVKNQPKEALAYMLTHNQTRQEYCDMKQACSEKGANIWPDYNQILKAKLQCRPDGITVEETEAKVPMQNLMNHTASRIFNEDQELKKMLQDLSANNTGELKITFYFKYGMDGCGSFCSFMQKDSTGKVRDLSSLMTSQMVPLQATALVGNETKIVYRNSAPNSANSCRPIRLSFERESKDTILRESTRLQDEVNQLVPFIVSEEPKIQVDFKGLFTMIDGKVLNELTSNPSSANCPICHKTSKQMSSQTASFEPVEGSLSFGVSPLHFGITSLELLYNIGYRQDTKKFGGRWTEEEREKKKACKKKVQAEFLDKLGLIIDKRRDGGAGNTTTGNVARRAFENAEVTAEICGVSPQLVKNIHTIWGTY